MFARYLWFMKQWYTFYATQSDATTLISDLDTQLDNNRLKLNQLGSEIQEQKLKQVVSELRFPSWF